MFCIRARVAVGLKKSLIKPRDFARAMSMLVEKVSFASENAKGECPAVFIKGKDSGSTRGLVVLQEWWGMNQQIQDEAKDIAKRGDFLAMVPDLYRGKVATDHETAGHYMSDLDWQGAVHDISGTKLTVYSTSTISYLGIPTPGWKTCTSLVKHCCDGVTTSRAFIVGDVIFVRFWVMVCIPVGIVYCDDPQQMPVK